MRIEEFIGKEWLEYADYDNRRSLPNLIDGLKITQRKAIYFGLSMAKGEKPLKVSQFASKAAAETAYHHGEASMMSTVVGLAQDHPGSNNYPLLEKHGQFGSRLSAVASSPRYIHTRMHANWSKFFLPVDQEIVEHLYDDDDKIEPKYYIPIIPMVLINGSEGVGNGFKSSILNYDITSVVRGLKEIIKHGKVKTPLLPSINGFTGTIEKEGRQVTFTGKLTIVHSTKIHITELPPGYDNDKYKKILNKLADDKFIKNYKNHSSEDKWDWIIECPRDTTALGEAKLLEKFGLIAKDTENFVGWGIDDSAPLTFETPESLLEYWYEERIKLYGKSLANQIQKMKALALKMDMRIRFIEWCLQNDIRKYTKAQFITLAVAGVDKLTHELANEFVSMPMYRITTDEVDKLADEIEKTVESLSELKKLTPVGVMESNLKGL